MTDINDYLITQDGKDWSTWLKGWMPPLPEDFTLWMVNRFGELIVVLEDGSVHMLDIAAGMLNRLADSWEDFFTKIDQNDNADNWLMITLTDACVAAGMTLEPNQCYSLVIPSFLGGQYAIDNIKPMDLQVYYELTADIYHQTKDLPDGAKVQFKFTD
jgi:hypothetical protein